MLSMSVCSVRLMTMGDWSCAWRPRIGHRVCLVCGQDMASMRCSDDQAFVVSQWRACVFLSLCVMVVSPWLQRDLAETRISVKWHSRL